MTDYSVPQQQLALSEQPQTQIDSSVFVRPNRVSIASGLEQLGAGLGDLATDAAKSQAQDDVRHAVTRDENRNLVVATPQNSLILGQAGDAYHEALVQGLRAQLTSSVSSDVAAVRAQNPTDAGAFKAGADAVADRYRQAYPGMVGNALAAQAQNETAQHQSNIVERNAERDVRTQLQAITTGIDDTNSKLRVLARQGAINTPEYDRLSDQLQDGYDALGGNKLFGYSQEKIDSEQSHAFAVLNGEYVVGRIDETFNRKGKAAAAEAIKTGIENNPDLDLSEAERSQLHAYAMSRLSYLSAEQQSHIAALKPTVDLQVKAYQTGNNGPDRVSDREFDQTYAQLQSLGAFKEADQLQAARIVSNRLAAFRNLPPDQQAAAVAAGVGGVQGPTGALGASGRGLINAPYTADPSAPYRMGAVAPQDMYSYLLAKGATKNEALVLTSAAGSESSFNPNVVHDGGIGLGLFGHNGDRLTAMRVSAGTFTPTWQQQADFALKELRGRPESALVNNATSADQLADAEMHYEQPRGYTQGNPRGGENYTGRIGTIQHFAATLKDAPAIASVAVPPAGAVPGAASAPQPFTDAEAAANPWFRAAYREQLAIDQGTQVQYAKAQFETLENGIKFAGAPTPEMLGPAATVLQIADRYPDQLGPQADKLRGALAGQPAGFAAAGAPGGGTTLLAQAEDMVRRSPGDRLSLAVGEGIKAGIGQGKKMLAEDPFGYAHRADWVQQKPPPIDLTSPEGFAALPQAMRMRNDTATAIGAHTGRQDVSAFAPADLPQIKSVMTSGTLDQRMSVLGSITNAGMSEPVLRATLGGLAEAKETLPLAVAGDLVRKQQYGPARDILLGQQAMQTEPKLAPNKDDFPGELAKVLPFNDLAPGAAREGIGAATQALYAKLSADAGDTTGVLNSDRLEKSVDTVTGGVRRYRGASFIAPWYGASEDQTDAAIRTLTNADFKKAQTTDGNPFPASALKSSFSGAFTFRGWRLQSYGDGKYLVFSGTDTDRQYLGAASGGKFVLDLGAKRADVERSVGRFQSRSIFQLMPGETPYPYGSSLDSAGSTAP